MTVLNPVNEIGRNKSGNKEVTYILNRDQKKGKVNSFRSIYSQKLADEYMDSISAYDGVNIAELAKKGKVFG